MSFLLDIYRLPFYCSSRVSRYLHPAFLPRIAIALHYYTFDTYSEVWSSLWCFRTLPATAAYLSSLDCGGTLPDIYVRGTPIRELYIAFCRQC